MRIRITLPQTRFNPRAYVRCDVHECGFRVGLHVSIHALKQGATKFLGKYNFNNEFQSTHLYKVRRGANDCGVCDMMFQSTHLYKVRRMMRLKAKGGKTSFNPRTYIRCDKD